MPKTKTDETAVLPKQRRGRKAPQVPFEYLVEIAKQGLEELKLQGVGVEVRRYTKRSAVMIVLVGLDVCPTCGKWYRPEDGNCPGCRGELVHAGKA